MTDTVFGKAAQALLGRFAIDAGSAELERASDIARILEGSGYELEKVGLVKGRLASTKDIRGGILESGDADPAVFEIDDRGIFIKDGEGKSAILGPEELGRYSSAWVLKEKYVEATRIAPFIARYRKSFIDLIACALVINFFALLFPLFSSFVYDKVLGNGITETLWAVAICLLIVMGIEFCMRIIRVSAAERFAVGSESDIDYGIFQRLLEARTNKIPGIAAFVEKYKQILSYRDFLSSSYLLSLADVPFIAFFLITIAAIGGPMVFIAVLCGCAMTAINALFIRPVLQYDAVAKNGSEKRFGLMTDLLLAREVVIGSAFRRDLQQKMQQASVETADAASRSRYWRGFSMSVSNTLSYLSYVGVIVAGVYMVESHRMTAGGLLAVSMLTSRAMSSVSSVSNLIIRYREFKTALKELNAVLPDIAPAPVLPSRGKLRGDLRIENITVTLAAGHKPVLDKIGFHVSPGEIVGIAGAPGSGKTTLLRIITGAVLGDSGAVYIDDIPIDKISQDDVSLTIGYKPQDLCLLEGSIESNVRAGRAGLSAQDRQDILKQSGLFYAFQQGEIDWETQIGPRGSRLSGGQRQSVSIARAMLYQPSLLLLDEPTNGFDANLETHIARQIGALRGKTTVLVSTHSHAVLSACDRIIALGQSKIIADGPREKVLRQPVNAG